MAIVDDDIARVRDAVDIVQLISRHLALKKVGGNFVGRCPFHQENTPSFNVRPQIGRYYCFGCLASGDAIDFVQQIDHLDFVGAVEQLAAQAGITLRYTDAHQGEARRERKLLIDVITKAVDFYHDRLLHGADAGAARRYLRARGFDGDLVREYRLGWAPDAWDTLARHLRVTDKVLADTGLGFVNRVNKQQDFFRARILFPIADAQGDPVGFGGRKLPDAEGPKYRNTSETSLYHKSKVLYGLDRAKTEIVQQDRVIICEGYTDVIGFARAGLPVAVATCGTALTEEHVKLLRRFSQRLILAFDPDRAGQAAAERVYEWERTHDLEVSVVALPEGEDPADLAQHDPDQLRAAVDEAQRFLGFRVGQALRGGDLRSPEGRAHAADVAAAMIAEHPDELVRDPYVMEVADRCRLDATRLRGRVEHFIAHPPERATATRARRPAPDEAAAGGRAAPAVPFRTTAETEALRVAVHRPSELLDRLVDRLFTDPVHVAVLGSLRAHGGDTRAAALASNGEEAALLSRLAMEETAADPADVLARLVDQATERALAEVERDARMSDDPLAFAALIGWIKLRQEELRSEGDGSQAAVKQLVAWLTEHVAEGA
ncbi:MAG TPA: DNA primase [Acidimicrobiales bacterium]|nr:DNA primase [Acidimicrobiales bacterium]